MLDNFTYQLKGLTSRQGQSDGVSQVALADVCNNPSIDIVVLAFVNVFPDQGPGNYPGTNFASACSGTTFSVDGVSTDLLDSCPEIGPGIDLCQANGKKVLLSIGGGAGSYFLKSSDSAEYFANFLWGAFGPDSGTGAYPRPFGSSAVDGFDLDIEVEVTSTNGLTAPDLYQYYPELITQLRTNYDGGSYYISAAPQCVAPDSHYPYISSSWFDFIFVQLYNTDACSARSFLSLPTPTYSFFTWLQQAYVNPATQVFAGLVSSPALAKRCNN